MFVFPMTAHILQTRWLFCHIRYKRASVSDSPLLTLAYNSVLVLIRDEIELRMFYHHNWIPWKSFAWKSIIFLKRHWFECKHLMMSSTSLTARPCGLNNPWYPYPYSVNSLELQQEHAFCSKIAINVSTQASRPTSK